MPWQNLRQQHGEGPPTTAAIAAIGAKHALAAHGLAAGLSGIIAPQNTVPVQRFNFSAAGTALLLEGKSCVFNCSVSPTK